MKLLTPKVRAAIYVLAVALFAVLGVYGLVTREQTAAWLELVAAAVALLALVNVPRSTEGSNDDDTE
jgi:uncharacterized membrane protein